MLNRHIQEELKAFLAIMPVVLIRGARQSGKTTLAQKFSENTNYSYFSLDEDPILAQAIRDPSGWINGLPKPVIIDEVQRAPEIFLPIKRDVDQNQKPGRYILTGSANPLLLPKLGDSLAGRMGLIDLHPFSQGEIHRKKETFVDQLFDEGFHHKKYRPLSRDALLHLLLKGGFPRVQSFDQENVNRWVNSYLQTMTDRDVRDLANVEGLREFPILFRLLASRSANLLNFSELSRSLGMSLPTVKRYVRLLEVLYFAHLLPAWFSNLGKRLTKAPKLHILDTAILANLTDLNLEKLQNFPSRAGQIVETFVFNELLKQKTWSPTRFDMFHFRDGTYEVDLLLEKFDGSIVGIEVKNSSSFRQDDLKGMLHLKQITKERFHKGIILYTGDEIIPIKNDIWAVPIQALWE